MLIDEDNTSDIPSDSMTTSEVSDKFDNFFGPYFALLRAILLIEPASIATGQKTIRGHYDKMIAMIARGLSCRYIYMYALK